MIINVNSKADNLILQSWLCFFVTLGLIWICPEVITTLVWPESCNINLGWRTPHDWQVQDCRSTLALLLARRPALPENFGTYNKREKIDFWCFDDCSSGHDGEPWTSVGCKWARSIHHFMVGNQLDTKATMIRNEINKDGRKPCNKRTIWLDARVIYRAPLWPSMNRCTN